MTDAPDPDAMQATAEAILAVADKLDKPPEIPTCGLIDLAAKWYYADPCETPSLNQSLAKKLLETSPEHVFYAHPKLGAGVKRDGDASAALKGGVAVHELLLGGDRIVKSPYDIWNTKISKKWKADVIRRGKIPMKEKDLKPLQEAADALRSKLAKRNVVLGAPPAQTEVSAFWPAPVDNPDGEGPPHFVQCRARLDELIVEAGERAVITDVKMCIDANPIAIEKSIENFHYGLQRSAYVEAIETVFPELAGKVDYVWIFCEWKPPFGVTVARANGELIMVGDMRWRRAKMIWERCLRTGEWPGYDARDCVSVGVPPWAMTRELEADAAFEYSFAEVA